MRVSVQNSTYSLRYYSPHYDNDVNRAILNLLEELKNKHGIQYEVAHLKTVKSEYGEHVEEAHEKQIYDTQFRPRAKILSARMGTSIRSGLRSRSGHYFFAGRIAIIKRGKVEWYNTYGEEFKEYDKGHSELGFLKALLSQGLSLLSSLCREVDMGNFKEEERLLDTFIDSDVLKGKFEREVRVGGNISSATFLGREVVLDYRKFIDALCHTDHETWILEAKMKLNYEAVGQVLVYRHLYKQQFPHAIFKLGIVCKTIEQEIGTACEELGIDIFQVVPENTR